MGTHARHLVAAYTSHMAAGIREMGQRSFGYGRPGTFLPKQCPNRSQTQGRQAPWQIGF